ncbi:glycoside hydrolase family 172 protein [Candidatus Hydrogenedentota bacterium]
MKRALLLLAFAIILASKTGIAAQKYTYVELVNRMIDMEGPAVLPVPGEKRAMWSSYDRLSRYDEKEGKYVNWDANLRSDRTGDGDGVIRMEGDQAVLAEMEGPGCIWRTYSANAKEGHVNIYLDGAEEPTIDLPFKDYVSGDIFPFNYPSLVYWVEATGSNNFVPMPYQESCKIVADKGYGRFYRFAYTSFPPGTAVPTFSMDLSAEDQAALQKINDFFANKLGTDPAGHRRGQATIRKSFKIGSKSTVEVAKITGERAITALKVKLEEVPDRDQASKFLREPRSTITWDGEKNPAILAPLGDFFGTVPGINLYKSLPMGMTEGGFYSYWYMPFAKGALIEIVNEGDMRCPIEFTVTHAPLTRPIEQLGRFHAKWHRDAFLPEDPVRAPKEHWTDLTWPGHALDWPMLKTAGRGRYCGVTLHVWNGKDGWWGEGDEKFFVDGEKFPSSFGTGTEEYFGYAWCRPDLFHRPYHSQTFNSCKNRGHVSLNRWHIADTVPFQSSFEGALEKFFPNIRPTKYAATAYWYLEPGGDDPYQPTTVEDRTGYYDYIVEPLEGPHIEIGAPSIRAELAKTTGGWISVKQATDAPPKKKQGGKDTRWSRLAWKDARVGHELVLELPPILNDGTYDIGISFAKGPQSGTVQLFMNDEKLGGPIELFSDTFNKTGEISFGRRRLDKGYQHMKVKIVSAETDIVQFGLAGISLTRKADW